LELYSVTTGIIFIVEWVLFGLVMAGIYRLAVKQ
jgi:hypothetical protein